MTGRLAAGTQARTAVETADTAGSQSHQIRANPYGFSGRGSSYIPCVCLPSFCSVGKKFDEDYTEQLQTTKKNISCQQKK